MTLLRKIWTVLEVLSLGFCIGWAICFTHLFFTAYLNPGHTILIDTDRFGEGGFEAVYFPVSIVVALIAWCRLVWLRAGRRKP